MTKTSKRLPFQLGFNPAGLSAWLIMDGPHRKCSMATTRRAAGGSLAKRQLAKLLWDVFYDASMKSGNSHVVDRNSDLVSGFSKGHGSRDALTQFDRRGQIWWSSGVCFLGNLTINR